MGKSSQRKGRAGEHEAALAAEGHGLQTRVHSIWEALDITIESIPYEVKRKKQIGKIAYDACHSGAGGMIFRSDREQWMITVPYRVWLEEQQELKRLRAFFENETKERKL